MAAAPVSVPRGSKAAGVHALRGCAFAAPVSRQVVFQGMCWQTHVSLPLPPLGPSAQLSVAMGDALLELGGMCRVAWDVPSGSAAAPQSATSPAMLMRLQIGAGSSGA
jgi:hypothetical protein